MSFIKIVAVHLLKKKRRIGENNSKTIRKNENSN